MSDGDVTRIAACLSGKGADSPFASCYDDLRGLAHALFAHEKPGHTLQPTALLHEAFLRLANAKNEKFRDPVYFFGAAARAMRRILTEHARREGRIIHGGGCTRVPLDALNLHASGPKLDWVAVDEAMECLERENERAYLVAMLRLFAGRGMSEIAVLTGEPIATVGRRWALARAYLNANLAASPGKASDGA